MVLVVGCVLLAAVDVVVAVAAVMLLLLALLMPSGALVTMAGYPRNPGARSQNNHQPLLRAL